MDGKTNEMSIKKSISIYVSVLRDIFTFAGRAVLITFRFCHCGPHSEFTLNKAKHRAYTHTDRRTEQEITGVKKVLT